MKSLLSFFLFFLMITGMYAQQVGTHTVSLTIKNIKTTNGQLVVGLFNDNSSFLKTPIIGKTIKVEGTTATFEFTDVKNGDYAISVFHDENSNNKLDTNMMGIPKERFACSNNAKGFMGPPKWEDAKFEVNKYLSVEISF